MSTKKDLNDIGPWDSQALAQMRLWDSAWTETCLNMSMSPWSTGILPGKLVELISLAIHACCTNLNASGTRRHIRGALQAGASRDEILTVLKMAFSISIHSASLGTEHLLEDAEEAGITPEARDSVATPVIDKMKAAGVFGAQYEPIYQIDPEWTEQIMRTISSVSNVFQPKEYEFLWIAFDASFTHMYAPGVRRHIRSAFRKGATVKEIAEVLKICVVQGIQSINLGVQILDEEMHLEKNITE